MNAFILVNGNLTYDASKSVLGTDEPVVNYQLAPSPVRRKRGGGGGGGSVFTPIGIPLKYVDAPSLEGERATATTTEPAVSDSLLRARIRELEETVVALRKRAASREPDRKAERKIEWLEAQLVVSMEKLAAMQAPRIHAPAPLAGTDRLVEARKAALSAAVAGGVTYALVPPSWPVAKKIGYSIAGGFAMKAVSIWIEEWLAAERAR